MHRLMHPRTTIKAACLAVVAALALTACGGNSSESDSTGSSNNQSSQPAKKSPPETEIEVMSDWTDSPDDPHVQMRTLYIEQNCFVETRSKLHADAPPLTPMQFCPPK